MLLTRLRVARVAADPSVARRGAEPGGWDGTVYYRLHGSPLMYRSPYSAERLVVVANALVESVATVNTWCIFDNTAFGAAAGDALSVVERIEEMLRPSALE
jgi:uncharacterized protein YecE (DUF72 family)